MDSQRSLDGGGVQQNREYAAPERRWAWVEIDREAIRYNLKRFRKLLGPDVKILAVVKADGYGHGAVESARVALSTGATVLGVASVDEGIELRHAGIAAPILILAEPPIEAIPLVLQHQLVPAVYNMEFALALGETADAQGRVSPYHLKIDTGMNRVGVHHSDAGDFLRTISFHRGLELQGVFTHFATADDIDTYEFRRQLERFEQALSVIRYMGVNPGTVHAANTSAAIRYRQSHYDMVRLGIGIYGLHPSEVTRQMIELRPAMSVHARVSFLKSLPVGEGVSYSYTYRSPGSVHVATLPIGYGDGLSRVLSNRMDVLVKGRRLPQVGTICMDMMMFEINQRSSALHPRVGIELGDEAIIVGKSGNEHISLDDMAQMSGTINYELACRFGLRLDRLFVD
jgi:alanine racemase